MSAVHNMSFTHYDRPSYGYTSSYGSTAAPQPAVLDPQDDVPSRLIERVRTSQIMRLAVETGHILARHTAALGHMGLQLVRRAPLETALIGLFMTGTFVSINTMLTQAHLHPAPLFLSGERAIAWDIRQKTFVINLPKVEGLEVVLHAAGTAAVEAIVRADLVREAQALLSQRSLYHGPVNGVNSPKLTKAIRSFELEVGMMESGEINTRLLEALKARSQSAATPQVERIVSQVSTVSSVQKRLADLGYGPLRFTGQLDTPTRTAIEQYQEDRLLARTGDINDRFLTDLALVTGRPL